MRYFCQSSSSMARALGACAPMAMFASVADRDIPAWTPTGGPIVSHDNVNTLCLSPALRLLIWDIEGHFGKKVVMNSGYRTPWHNAIGRRRGSVLSYQVHGGRLLHPRRRQEPNSSPTRVVMRSGGRARVAIPGSASSMSMCAIAARPSRPGYVQRMLKTGKILIFGIAHCAMPPLYTRSSVSALRLVV